MKRILCFIMSLITVTSVFSAVPFTASAADTAAENDICINEVCAKNNSCLADSNGNYPDWAELYNSSDKAVSLDGFYLTDKESNLKRFSLDGIVIEAKSYLIIYCASVPDEFEKGEYYSGFAISASGETVMLTNGTDVISSITVTNIKADQSLSRIPDASDNLVTTVPTPGYSNNDASSVDSQSPVFSVSSGFYDDEFDVIITAPENCKIYYTLDSSNPTAESYEYTEPIHITDASQNENVYSARTDISAAQLSELIEEYCDSYCFSSYSLVQTPEEKVDKCTVLRAIYIDENGNESDITTASYFVGLSDDEEYQDVSVASLISDPDNLFGYENGIFVLGQDFDEYYENELTNDESTAFKKELYWWWNANYRRDDKVEGVFEYFDDTQEYVGTDKIDISIKGVGSRGFMEKSINITANSAYSGNNVLSFNVLSDKREKGITLFAGGDDYLYKTDDYIAAQLASDLDIVSYTYKPCQVFLDGEYWGFFYIADRTTSKVYYEENYNVDGDDLAIIKVYTENGDRKTELNEGTESDLSDFLEIYNYCCTNSMSDNDNYEYFCEYFDIDSLIDYYSLSIYIGRYADWPDTNWAVWRCNDTSDEEYHDKKWRYILFDVNSHSMDYSDSDTLTYVLSNDSFFASLYENASFREQFTERYKELVELYFNTDNVNAIIKDMSDTAEPFVAAGYKRYYGDNFTIADYESNIDSLYSFYAQRSEFTLTCLEQVNAQYDSVDDTSALSYTDEEDASSEIISSDTLSENTSTVAAIDTVKLSKTTYVYNGNKRKPTVTVTDVNGNVISSDNYTVTYQSGRKKVGKYKVTVKLTGDYSGTKTLYFTIKPKKTSVKKITAKSKAFTVKWKKRTTQVTGYQVQYATNKKFTKNKKTVTVKSKKTTSKTIKNLKSNKTYYVRVRTYKTVDGKKIYSNWSAAKKVTIK